MELEGSGGRWKCFEGVRTRLGIGCQWYPREIFGRDDAARGSLDGKVAVWSARGRRRSSRLASRGDSWRLGPGLLPPG